MKFTIILPASGKFKWLATPALLSLSKYWSGMIDENLVIISDDMLEVPFPAQCSIHPSDQIKNDLSGVLKRVLEAIDTEIVFILCADIFLTRPLDNNKLKILARYITDTPDVIKGAIKHDKALIEYHDFVAEFNGLNIIKCNDWRHCSGINGDFNLPLFKRKLLLSLLQPGWSIQEAERQIIEWAQRKNLYGVGTDPALTDFVELHNNSRQIYWHFDQLDEDDQELIRQYQPKDIRWE